MWGLALVVDDVAKGQRLAFRYPSTRIPGSAPNDDAGLALFGTGDDDFAKLFRPKPALCGQVFELTIDELRFISYPVLCTDDRDADLSLFSFVFVLPAPLWSRRVPARFRSPAFLERVRTCVTVLARAAAAEERRCRYVSHQARIMLRCHDDHIASHSSDGAALVQHVLLRSRLAQEMKQITDGLASAGAASVLLNRWRPISLDTRRPAEHPAVAGGALPPAPARARASWRPYHSLLLLRDRAEVLRACGGSAAPRALRQVVELASPTRSLADLEREADATAEQVRAVVAHLVQWRLARRVHALHRGSVLRIHPAADIRVGGPTARAFAAAFPAVSFWRLLALVGRVPAWAELAEQLGRPAAEKLVAWLLARGVLEQVAVHAFLRTTPAAVDGACAACGVGPAPTPGPAAGPAPCTPCFFDDPPDWSARAGAGPGAEAARLAALGAQRPDLLAVLRGGAPLLDGRASAEEIAFRLGVRRRAVIETLGHFRAHIEWTLFAADGGGGGGGGGDDDDDDDDDDNDDADGDRGEDDDDDDDDDNGGDGDGDGTDEVDEWFGDDGDAGEGTRGIDSGGGRSAPGPAVRSHHRARQQV